MKFSDPIPRERPEEDKAAGSGPTRVRSSYCAPRLRVLGDLRTVTLGSTFGPADSGNPNFHT
jgi:hypothetical protein